MSIFKKRGAHEERTIGRPEHIDPLTGLPWGAERYRPEPFQPAPFDPNRPAPVTGVYAPGQRLRDIRRENGATDDDLNRRGRGYSGGGSGWGGIN